MSNLPWGESHPITEAATPLFELTSNDKGELVVDMGEDGEVVFNPEQQGVVLQIAGRHYAEGLRGEGLRQAIITSLIGDMTSRRSQSESVANDTVVKEQ